MLLKHKYGKQALDYLNRRMIKEPTIKEFHIGYAPDSWDSLSRYLNKQGFTNQDIVAAGVSKFKKNEKDVYDLFRGRLMFPLYDHMERIIGFAGRALKDGQEPKYFNTPETPVFHKERFLYGLHLSKTAIRQAGFAVIVEGEFDMISPYQQGLKNIVASKGTAITPSQIKLLKRYTDNITLIFDSDKAGLDAAVRGVEIILNADADIKVAMIPSKYKDPDDIAKEDIKILKELLQKAIPLWDFFFIYSKQKYDFNDIYQKQKASEFLAEKIALIRNEVIFREYSKKFAEVFDLEDKDALNIIQNAKENKFEYKDSVDNIKIVPIDDGLKAFPPAELYLLVLLLRAENKLLKIYADNIEMEYFSNPVIRDVFSNIKSELKEAKTIDIKELYDKLLQYSNQSHNLLESVYLYNLEDRLEDPGELEKEIASVLKRLKKTYLENEVKLYGKALKKAEAISDFEETKKLQHKIRELTEELSKVAS
jgi:DNA primase